MSFEEIPDRLYRFLLKLPKHVLLNVMLEALDEMQGYNGRSYTACIMLAIGAEDTEEGRWKLPSLASVKKQFG